MRKQVTGVVEGRGWMGHARRANNKLLGRETAETVTSANYSTAVWLCNLGVGGGMRQALFFMEVHIISQVKPNRS